MKTALSVLLVGAFHSNVPELVPVFSYVKDATDGIFASHSFDAQSDHPGFIVFPFLAYFFRFPHTWNLTAFSVANGSDTVSDV